jgi:hypothetical protein
MPKKNNPGRASEDLLATLHNAVASDLLRKVQSGEATAQELSAAIKFLKDNGIEMVRETGNPIDHLAKALPSFDDFDDEPYVN